MKTSLIDKRTTNYVPLFMLVILVSQGLICLFVFGQWLSLYRLSKKQLAFVQTESGEVFQVQAIDADERTPETIRQFATKTLYLMFNWSGEIAGADGKRTPDKGIEIDVDGKKVKIPSAVLYASYAFSADFQKPLLKKISEIVPTGVFGGSTKAVLILDHVSSPKELEPGKWEVRVVGHHHLVGNSLPGKKIPFTKAVYVEALDVPAIPVGKTPLEQAVYGVRQARLQIYAMDELK